MIGYYPIRWRRRPLSGWGRWVIAVSLPFLPLFFEAYLNARMLDMDYEVAEINSTFKELQEELDDLSVDAAQLERMDLMEIAAPDLGMIAPEPDQIQVIYFVENQEPSPIEEAAPYVLASRTRAGR